MHASGCWLLMSTERGNFVCNLCSHSDYNMRYFKQYNIHGIHYQSDLLTLHHAQILALIITVVCTRSIVVGYRYSKATIALNCVCALHVAHNLYSSSKRRLFNLTDHASHWPQMKWTTDHIRKTAGGTINEDPFRKALCRRSLESKLLKCQMFC